MCMCTGNRQSSEKFQWVLGIANIKYTWHKIIHVSDKGDIKEDF